MDRNKPALVTFHYIWLHMPSGEQGIKVWEGDTRGQFLESLNTWNAQQPRTWKYWEVKP